VLPPPPKKKEYGGAYKLGACFVAAASVQAHIS
jgi:hypothetical protein